MAGDVHSVVTQQRAAGPVVWVSAIDGWLILSRAMALQVMRDAETFTVDDPRFTTGQVVGPSMLSLDGAEHDRHRSPFVGPYRRGSLGQLEEWVGREAQRLASGLVARGEAELRTQLAAPLATATIHRSLGLVGTDPETMLEWYRAIAGSVSALSANESIGTEGARAMGELRGAVDRTLKEEPAAMLSRLAGGTLTDDELAQNVAIILFGAIETAEGMTANALWHLLSHPGQLSEVRDQRDLLANAVEESLRMEPAASVVDRYATCDISLGRASVRKGDLVRVSLAGANRDPEVFERPDSFDLHRRQSRLHLSFAAGPHICIGLLLARIETAAAINAVLDALPEIELDLETSTPPSGLIFRKPEAVVARWVRPVAQP